MLPVVCCRSDIASSDAIFQRSFRRIRVIDFERSTILYHFHAFEISNGARGTDLKFKSIRSDHYRNFVTRLRADWHIFSDLERRMDGWIPSLSRDPILDVSTFRRDRGGGRKRRARLILRDSLLRIWRKSVRFAPSICAPNTRASRL